MFETHAHYSTSVASYTILVLQLIRMSWYFFHTFVLLTVVVFKYAAASHFRGALLQWRPVDPMNFDGQVHNLCSDWLTTNKLVATRPK